jgi:hypothetical protein
MCVNGKMRPVKPIPRMEERRMEKNHGGGKFSYDIFDIL